MWLVLLTLACAPENPTAASDCSWVLSSGEKKNCMVAVALATFRTDAAAGVAFTESQVADEVQRDFIFLQAVNEIPSADPRLCEKIVSDTFRAACEVAARRPHLKSPGIRRVPPALP